MSIHFCSRNVKWGSTFCVFGVDSSGLRCFERGPENHDVSVFSGPGHQIHLGRERLEKALQDIPGNGCHLLGLGLGAGKITMKASFTLWGIGFKDALYGVRNWPARGEGRGESSTYLRFRALTGFAIWSALDHLWRTLC